MVLFEKQSGTTTALVVTPLQPWQYLLSKSISLSLPAVMVSFFMGLASNADVNYTLLFLSVILTSVLFLLLGFIGAQRVKTFNQYLIIIPMFLTPLCIPIVDFFGWWKSPLMWIVPTQSSLTLLKGAFNGIEWLELCMSIAILVLAIAIAWRWAVKEYIRGMATSD
jgi:fluoroquinolone transport system permease protein